MTARPAPRQVAFSVLASDSILVTLTAVLGTLISAPTRPPPHPTPSRTNRTRRVPHPVLIGHAASVTPY